MGRRKRQPKPETPSDAASEPKIEQTSGEAADDEDGFEILRSAVDRQPGKDNPRLPKCWERKQPTGSSTAQSSW
jgi:hypothetical protein